MRFDGAGLRRGDGAREPRRWRASSPSDIPEIDIPASHVEAVERDRNAGVELACEQVLAIRDSGAFDGVHLVPVSRYRDVAARLERELG